MIEYNTEIYNFQKVVSDLLEVEDLTKLHEVYYDEGFKEENYMKGLSESLQNTYFHKKFYGENNKEFLLLYKKFIKEVIAQTYKEKILYQKVPTFRIQVVDSVSVGGLDFDKNSKKIGIVGLHRDRDYNHSDKEMNYFLPFTDTNKYNTIWAESEPNKSDYSPFLLRYGQVKKWSGANLMHGNVVNVSGLTRVSIDFRILKMSDFEGGKKSLTQKIR